jgi:hypothetical protein
MPSAFALSRSMVSVACSALFCRSDVTSVKLRSRVIASAIFCDQSFSAATSIPCMTNWYWLFDDRPPMLRFCTGTM